MVPSAAAATASSPSRPPVGTMMRPPCCLRELEQFGTRQQRAAGEHHHLLAGGEHRPADLLEDRGRRALDREVGMRREIRRARRSAPRSPPRRASRAPSPRRAPPRRRASSPGMPSASLRASARPMVPSPAMAMRMSASAPPCAAWRSYAATIDSGNARLTRLHHADKARDNRISWRKRCSGC